MLRLFLSLYLLITLGLLIINLSSSLLFQALETDVANKQFQDMQIISQISKGYVPLVKQQQISVEQLQANLNIPVAVLVTLELGFLPEQLSLLADNQTVQLFNSQSQLLLYNQVSPTHVLQIGPIELAEPSSSLEQGLFLLSYLMLAGFILMWSRPLWRDLNRLVDMTTQISKDAAVPDNQLSERSVLFPLGKSLSSMAKRIEDLLSLQKQMLHAVSHDIRTPLARMKFSLAMLDNAESNKQIGDTQQSLLSDVKEVDSLIDNLLSFAKIDSAEYQLQKQDVDLAELIHNLTDKLSPLSNQDIEIKSPAHLSVECDGHLIERAIQNLIVNSQKFAEQKILIALKEDKDTVQICVEDDGIGIPEEQAQTVLQPFNRVESSRNKQSGGFGLGLTIVSKIVKWHQGKISITQSPLGGAQVSICLPK